ncbi:MAG: Xaa-Pro peptidase family protein [Deltaproteobacteria bacterium]|nr:Xaa-Pro peptidase family protein [Deltaproteobacteria bacterium]
MLANRERILQKMEEFKLDAIIASHPENVSYLANFQSHLPYMYRFLNVESYALFARSADIAPCLIVASVDATWAARFPSWVPEVYTYGSPEYVVYPEGTLSAGEKKYKQFMDDRSKNAPSPGQAIVKALKDKGLDKGRIGLDEKNLYAPTREQILQDLPKAKILDAFELFRVIRMVKTPEEIERLRTVGMKNDRAYQSVFSFVREGVSEDEISQKFLESVAKEGAIFEFWNTASGTQTSMVIMSSGHFEPLSGYSIKKGDLFRFDGGCIYNKYHSDHGGCGVVGTPTAKHKACYSAITAGMNKAMELLRPGAIPSKIFQEVVSTVAKAGLKDYPRVATFCGHGIGIEARDYPIFTNPVKATSPFLPGTYDLPIEENMVVNIEVPYDELGLGGFQIEYTLLVKKDGCEKLFPHDRELMVLK